MKDERAWWKEAVVYQIYPRSFCDSNADGIGDLRGILSKLDYLQELGVNVLWLCPVYQSPNDDNGYDISDYYTIMPEFGTMADFEELLSKAHERGLKIIMDLVVNHTSDEHAWFAESRKSKQSEKRDYYIWRPGKDGKEPSNWASFFTPSAWEFDETSGEYYLHLFSKKQPDLNWNNPKLRADVYTMMKWWLNKGIDGFRMDVINCISKAAGFPDAEPSGGGYQWAGQFFMNGPNVHDYLREMNEQVLCNYNIMTVGETPGAAPEDALFYAGSDGRELNMVFQSELMDIDAGKSGKWDGTGWRLSDFKRIIGKWQTELHEKAWNSIFLGNHDQPRIVSRFGNDAAYRVESAKLLATMMFTLEGTPYIFQGEEIGMTNKKFESIADCRDIETLEYYESARKSGLPETEILERICRKSRDNARTPMQWNAATNAGFSTGSPWIPVNPNYERINVENQNGDDSSVLHYYRRLIRLRRENPVLIYGSYQPLFEGSEEIMAYQRKLATVRTVTVLNFSGHDAVFAMPEEYNRKKAQLLIGNIRTVLDLKQREIDLKPYEALVLQWEDDC